jgi:uncharacterized protein YjdB/GH25 family lysozyme M1 (1,4-beta-N-acetylmuramidase)
MKKQKMISLALVALLSLSSYSFISGQAVKAIKTNAAKHATSQITAVKVKTTAGPSIISDGSTTTATVGQTNNTTTAETDTTNVPFVDANGNTIGTTVEPKSLAQTMNNTLISESASASTYMKGIDVYSGTNITDWNAVKNAGVQAVYIKLTDGLTYNNPQALAQYNGAKSVGLKVGAYHFAERNDVDSEYNHFITQASKYQWDLKPVLDYEPGGTPDYNYISRFMAKDSNLILYGSHSIVDNTGLPINKIWVAEPSDAGSYVFTGTTKGYAGIQYLWNGSISGLQGDADVDLFSDDILLKPKLPAIMCVDTPTSDSTISNSVNIVGWALNQSGDKQVDILVDGVEKGTATIGQSRTDVQAVYPSYGIVNSGYSYTLDASSLNYGNHNITVVATGNDGTTSSENINVVKSDPTISATGVGVTYRTHVQNLGIQPYVRDGEEAGTDGQSLRAEAFNLSLVNAPAGASIQYQAYVQNIGWQSLVSDGAEAGTDGQGLRMEAFKIKLVNMPNYSVMYQAYVQNIGWQNWVSDGGEAGTEGQSLRVEAMRIKLVPKVDVTSISLNKSSDTLNVGDTDALTTSISPSNATNNNIDWTSSNNAVATVDKNGKITAIAAGSAVITAQSEDGNKTATCSVTVNSKTQVLPVGVSYTAHVQNIGWMPSVSDGAEAGTDGKSLRVEALKINLVNAPAGASIQYQAHVQNIGWQSLVSDGAEAGTDGKSLRVEALKIKLVNMPGYSVQYRAHVQNIGWQNWVSDGAEAGTDGQSLRVEAIEIRVVPTSN